MNEAIIEAQDKATPPDPQHGREPCKTCMGSKRIHKRPASADGLTPEIPCPDCREPEAENQANTKPCPHNSTVSCVQYPDDNCCGCDPCEECEVKLNAVKPLAQYLTDYVNYEIVENFTEPKWWSLPAWHKLFQQALDAYQSTENVTIKIERV